MTPQAYVDERDVQQVAVRYATALDAKDWDLLRTCFRPDASIHYPFGPVDGYDAIEQVCRRALEPLDASQHLLGNFVVQVTGDRATCSCYFQAQHVRYGSEGGDLYTVGGRYVDELVRVEAGWVIALRRLERMWISGNQGVLAVPGRPGGDSD
jgi:3-phenylpropionate/cinnamic acid dioxygenase small subunit